MIKDKKNYHILIVEDNAGDYLLVEDFLYDYIQVPEIKWVKSFLEAKETLLDPMYQFDVILLDLSLPDKTGEILIKEIVKLGSISPLIVLTGYTDNDFGVKSLSMGVSDYILKDELTAVSLYKSIVYSSERVKIINDLEKSEKKYGDLFHLSPVPMWVFDIDTLSFLDVNKAAITHYGYTREEFLSMTIRDIRPKEEISLLEETVQKYRYEQELFINHTFKHLKKDGTIINVDLKSSLVQFNDKPAKIVLANDVTEKVKYFDALKAQNQKLQDISWMQSHTIRAPLSRILGLIQLMDHDVNAEELKQVVSYIKDAANDLDDVIRAIADNATAINI